MKPSQATAETLLLKDEKTEGTGIIYYASSTKSDAKVFTQYR